MKVFFVLCVTMLFAVATFGQPVDLEDVGHMGEDHHIENSRFKRFTCDVLSLEAGTIKLNHAACGAHCLMMGRTGGYCNDQAVCVCR